MGRHGGTACRATARELAALFRSRLEDPATIPFAVTDGRTGALLGTTSLRDYVPDQQRLEIGGTFYGRQFWGSHVNPASKHMLLAYAYEVLEVDRVAFRCDARNTRSATAIERLGAQFEGVLRGHRAAPGGGRADTAVFSILSQEWPQVREDLRRRLAPFAVGADYALGSFAATWNPYSPAVGGTASGEREARLLEARRRRPVPAGAGVRWQARRRRRPSAFLSARSASNRPAATLLSRA